MLSEPDLGTLFLSYAHEDHAKAQRLAGALQRAGYRVWWDALIEGGTRYARTIDQALGAADVVIVLWSQESVQSDWVCDEAAQGRDRGRLVPLSLDGTPPPLGFRQIQAVDLSRWNGRANAPQFTAVRRAVATALGHDAPSAAPIAQPGVSRRQMFVGASALTFAAAGIGIGWESGLFGSAKSIAVLPFKNIGNDPSQSVLSDGLTDGIRSALARNDGLMVLAAASSETAAKIAGGAKSRAQKLGVAYLVEGSVQREGDLVRVVMDLINGRSGFNEWSQQFDRQLNDVFAFESEIAQTVSGIVSVKMAATSSIPGGTRNVGAVDAYFQGLHLFNLDESEETARESRNKFELAIEADPNFALAHAFLSRALAAIADEYAAPTEIKTLYDSAIEEARHAIVLAPTLPHAHLALGYATLTGKLDVRGARASYVEAYALGHGDAEIVDLYALYMGVARRFADAGGASERATGLDPLNPYTFLDAGTVAFQARRFADALPKFERALQLHRDVLHAHGMIGDCLLELKQLDAARAAYDAERSDMHRLRGQGILEHRAGNQAAAKSAFDQLVKVPDSIYQQAEVLAQWGRFDEAFERLQRARAVGDSGLTYLATDPFLDPIARDRRFAQLIRSIGFV